MMMMMIYTCLHLSEILDYSICLSKRSNLNLNNSILFLLTLFYFTLWIVFFFFPGICNHTIQRCWFYYTHVWWWDEWCRSFETCRCWWGKFQIFLFCLFHFQIAFSITLFISQFSSRFICSSSSTCTNSTHPAESKACFISSQLSHIFHIHSPCFTTLQHHIIYFFTQRKRSLRC